MPDYDQPAVRAQLGRHAPGEPLPVTEAACREVLTLPCFPELQDAEVMRVAEAVTDGDGVRRSLDVVVPVYGNADSLPQLLIELAAVAAEAESRFAVRVRAVFVVDGSPDDSLAVLQRSLPAVRLESTLIDHSRNFGSFAAIRTGLAATSADWYCSLAADLQEPTELVLDFLRALIRGADVAVGTRASRDDAVGSRWASGTFWRLYRRLINRDIPSGGVDTFACSRQVRDELAGPTGGEQLARGPALLDRVQSRGCALRPRAPPVRPQRMVVPPQGAVPA